MHGLDSTGVWPDGREVAVRTLRSPDIFSQLTESSKSWIQPVPNMLCVPTLDRSGEERRERRERRERSASSGVWPVGREEAVKTLRMPDKFSKLTDSSKS